MNVFELKEKIDNSGEYILGAHDTGSHACYLIYGVLKGGEKERMLKPGKGHEELAVSIKGDFRVRGHLTGMLKEGQAIHLKDEETCWLENVNDFEAVYIIAGGHATGGHH